MTKHSGAHDQKPKNKKFGGNEAGFKGAAERTWCSIDETTSHGDEGCNEQGVPRSDRKGAHLASAGSPPVTDDKPPLHFDDTFYEVFAFSGRTAGNGLGISVSNPRKFTMPVDSGVSDHFVGDELIPAVRQGNTEYQKL